MLGSTKRFWRSCARLTEVGRDSILEYNHLLLQLIVADYIEKRRAKDAINEGSLESCRLQSRKTRVKYFFSACSSLAVNKASCPEVTRTQDSFCSLCYPECKHVEGAAPKCPSIPRSRLIRRQVAGPGFSVSEADLLFRLAQEVPSRYRDSRKALFGVPCDASPHRPQYS